MKRLLAGVLALLVQGAAAQAAESPWNGTWTLDAARSSPGAKDGAAADYAFTLAGDGALRWEIPSLQEVVTGKADGAPMPIVRPGAPAGMTIAVSIEGPTTWRYQVVVNGDPKGEGRMTLVDGGQAWVDIVWPTGKPELASELVYVRAAKDLRRGR